MDRTYQSIILREPTIIDENMVMDLRAEFFNTHCKFNGTNDLNLFNSYIDWFAHTLRHIKYNCNINADYTSYTYLIIKDNLLLGMAEIIQYINLNTMKKSAHIIECVRPSQRRKGYGKPIIRRAIEECRSLGIKKEFITYEMNSKASADKMGQITDF